MPLTYPGHYERSDQPTPIQQSLNTPGTGVNALWNSLNSQNLAQNAYLDQQTQNAIKNFQYSSQLRRAGYDAQVQDNAGQAQDIAAQLAGIGNERNYYNLQPGFINRQYGLEMRGAANQEAGARADFGTNMRHLFSNLAARGAGTSEGARADRSDLQGQLARQLEDVGITRDTSQLGKEKSLAQNTLNLQRLDTEAQRLGIQRDQLQKGLDNALQQLGLKDKIDALDLFGNMQSNDYQKMQSSQAVYQTLIEMIQKDPTLLGQLK